MAFSDFIDLKYLIHWLISLLPTDTSTLYYVDPIEACLGINWLNCLLIDAVYACPGFGT